MFTDISARIPELDEAAMQAARTRQDALTKPPGSLGRLEELTVQLAGISAENLPSVANKVIITMAGDHGVVAEGVSAFPQEVTSQMVQNFLHGGAAINVLARYVGARITVVDMGVAAELDVERQPVLGGQSGAVDAVLHQDRDAQGVTHGIP